MKFNNNASKHINAMNFQQKSSKYKIAVSLNAPKKNIKNHMKIIRNFYYYDA